MSIKAQRLAKGQPTLAGEAVLNDGAPQNEHVNPAIAPMGCGVPGHSDRGFRRRRPQGWTHGAPPASSSGELPRHFGREMMLKGIASASAASNVDDVELSGAQSVRRGSHPPCSPRHGRDRRPELPPWSWDISMTGAGGLSSSPQPVTGIRPSSRSLTAVSTWRDKARALRHPMR
jgi:hypothetical protein